MTSLQPVAERFVAIAHEIVWCTFATVAPDDRPRTRILHPLWQWDGDELRGVIATGPTPIKRADLDHRPFASCNYWSPSQDVATADCAVSWSFDDQSCTEVWEAFKAAPEPVGYDPAIIEPWAAGPTSDAFAVLRLRPYRLRVVPGPEQAEGAGEVLSWRR